MFFKKKKVMNDNKDTNTTENVNNADNLSQQDTMEEILSNVLNTDDSGNSGAPLPESNDDGIEKVQQQLDEMKDKHLRLIAEFDNLRRRTAKEKNELIATASKEIITSLLVVLDDMSRAEKQIDKAEDVAAIKEGISLVFSKFRNILQNKGLKEMEAINLEFNVDIHEAITEIPAPKPALKGKIIDVLEPGYYLNDKLIRYAKVVVGN